MATRPYYQKNKYNYSSDDCDMEEECDDDDESCPTDPDLLLLRQNAKGEREAIAFYLRAAAKTSGPLCELFLHTAQDEMIHFRNSMTLLAKYDPIQAQAFEGVDIDLPDELRKAPSTKYCPEEKLEIIDLLTKSIADELAAINMYQESYEQASHADVKSLFCNNGNDEKHHVAEFWKALMVFTKENTLKS
ncbi:MAG: hypothetical protein H6Q68_3844 [Firmicutes bacterium]|nr:hypothetical protein [Bacillota bacterium]